MHTRGPFLGTTLCFRSTMSALAGADACASDVRGMAYGMSLFFFLPHFPSFSDFKGSFVSSQTRSSLMPPSHIYVSLHRAPFHSHLSSLN
jgi:hypothetical protein